jgi:predicted negative regulator of RcsB-dependent stress response
MAEIDTIFEQVDEQIDADKAHKFWKENRKFIVGGLILLFAGLFAYVGWKDVRMKEDQALSDSFIQSQTLTEKGDLAGSEKILQNLMAESGDHGYGLLATLVNAQALAKAGKVTEAVAGFEALAAKTANSPLQGLALLNAAYLTVEEKGRAKEFLAKIDEKSPFRPHALELEGLLLAREGDMKNALARYQEALQLGADGELRSRLNTRLERLAGNI